MQSFVDRYEELRESLNKAAKHLEELLEVVLRDHRILVLAVSVRVKTLESALRKVMAKGYEDPWREMMDVVGGRVFTYFRPDASRVESAIRETFTVHEEHCANKFDDLEFNRFGYTSRHLVCSLPNDFPDLRLKALIPEGMKVEIQIRSVLEHGWAEIEHELVYKSGTQPPDPIRRRFAASAAALEIVEREFDALRGFELEMARQRIGEISQNLDARLDRAWFVAVLLREYPERATWSPDPRDDVFFGRHELSLIESLRGRGISTVRQFRARLRRAPARRLVREYAVRRGLPESGVSHLPIAMFAAFFDCADRMPQELRRVADATMRELLRM